MGKVSIIMPAYNCAKYITESIASVTAQTYTNWELLIVDDASTDNTQQVVEELAKKDSRIKYIRLEKNSGAAVARNTAIEKADGRYMAFLDSDDLWYPEKLKKQLGFMQENGYSFTCTTYEWIDETGKPTGKIKKPFKRADYNLCLYYGDPIGNSTVIYDAQALGKFFVPPIRKRNDFAMWLQVLKKEKYIYGLREVLASYRSRSDSLSKKKFGLLKYQWQLYREIEKLNIVKAGVAILTLFIRKAANAICNK